MIEHIKKTKIIEQECKFQMLSPSKKFNKIQLPVSQFAGSEIYTRGGGALRISSDREDQMGAIIKT